VKGRRLNMACKNCGGRRYLRAPETGELSACMACLPLPMSVNMLAVWAETLERLAKGEEQVSRLSSFATGLVRILRGQNSKGFWVAYGTDEWGNFRLPISMCPSKGICRTVQEHAAVPIEVCVGCFQDSLVSDVEPSQVQSFEKPTEPLAEADSEPVFGPKNAMKGEPWSPEGSDNILDCDELPVASFEQADERDRALACVAACAGVVDPKPAEVGESRMAISRLAKELALACGECPIEAVDPDWNCPPDLEYPCPGGTERHQLCWERWARRRTE